MGFSPGEGLMMGVRAGDFDPSIVPYMAARLGVEEKTGWPHRLPGGQ